MAHAKCQENSACPHWISVCRLNPRFTKVIIHFKLYVFKIRRKAAAGVASLHTSVSHSLNVLESICYSFSLTATCPVCLYFDFIPLIFRLTSVNVPNKIMWSIWMRNHLWFSTCEYLITFKSNGFMWINLLKLFKCS